MDVEFFCMANAPSHADEKPSSAEKSPHPPTFLFFFWEKNLSESNFNSWALTLLTRRSRIRDIAGMLLAIMCCQDASSDNRRLVRAENYDDSVELFTPWNSFFSPLSKAQSGSVGEVIFCEGQLG